MFWEAYKLHVTVFSREGSLLHDVKKKEKEETWWDGVWILFPDSENLGEPKCGRASSDCLLCWEFCAKLGEGSFRVALPPVPCKFSYRKISLAIPQAKFTALSQCGENETHQLLPAPHPARLHSSSNHSTNSGLCCSCPEESPV